MAVVASTSSRMFRLLSLLQSHRFWPGCELADRLEVSIRTLRRDVDRLRDLGYPVRSRRGVDGGYQLAAGAVLPPLTVDDEEAVAIAVSLLGAARNPAEATADAAVRALVTVMQVMPEPLRRRMQALRGATDPSPFDRAGRPAEPAVLTALAQACRDTERVSFDYVDATGAASTRAVEPLRLVPAGQRWYLVAYDLDRWDWRSFRLDRISRVRPQGGRFAPRRLPAADAASFVRDRLRGVGRRHAVIAVVDEAADAVRGRIGQWADVEPDGPGRCRVRVHGDSLDWAMLALGVLDRDFVIEGPPEALARAASWGRRLTRAAAPPDPRRSPDSR